MKAKIPLLDNLPFAAMNAAVCAKTMKNSAKKQGRRKGHQGIEDDHPVV